MDTPAGSGTTTGPAGAPPARLLGVLGGMSWASTAEYYRLLNEGVGRRLGGLHSARLLLHSVDSRRSRRCSTRPTGTGRRRVLEEAACGLRAAGATGLLLATNTMHKVADRVEATTGLPLLHIVDATAEAVRAVGAARVGLLGTAFTMEDDFFAGRLARHDVATVTPGPGERDAVHRVIYDELCHGVVADSSRALYRRVIAGLVRQGAEAVVLGCTEVGLLVGAEDADVPVVDTTRVHCDAAVEWMTA